MSESPADAWRTIRKSGQGDGNLEIPSLHTGVDTGYGPARYALGPNEEPRLLVPCGDVRASANFESSANLIAGHTFLLEGGRKQCFIDIMVVDRRLDKVFGEIVDEMLRRLDKGHTPDAAVGGTISDFRDLLLTVRKQVVSIAESVGLLGELIALDQMTDIAADAIDAWTGPFGQRHDFRKRLAAIEVKTSTRSDTHQITIHGPDQLLEPTGGNMHLVHVRLEQAHEGSCSIQSIFRRLVDKQVARTKLDSGLRALGCDDPESEEWNRFTAELEGFDLYQISEGFPRIIPHSFSNGHLPSGVTGLSYDIDLTLARRFLLPETKKISALSEFLS